MNIYELLLISIALSMDAFAISVCKGIAIKKIDFKKIIVISLYFGLFQAIMPIIGYLVGNKFGNYFENIDHWITFILLSIIGLNMIKESFENNTNEMINVSTDIFTMMLLALATSIDALTVGISFAILKVNIIKSSLIIGFTTYIFSLIGIFLGIKAKSKLENKAMIFGGVILIILGFKILVEHLGYI